MIPDYQQEIIRIKISRAEIRPKQTIVLGIVAGIFIAMGGLLMSLGVKCGFNPVVNGLLFSSGLFQVVFSGAELFTGNCMISGLLPNAKPTKLLVNNYISNMLGAITLFAIVVSCRIDWSTLADIAAAKCNQPGLVIFMKGAACNILVCLAVYLAVYLDRTHSALERFMLVIFPVTLFVACGFEHSVANMFFLPFGILDGQIDIIQAICQLGLATAGNVVGGIFIGSLLEAMTRED